MSWFRIQVVLPFMFFIIVSITGIAAFAAPLVSRSTTTATTALITSNNDSIAGIASVIDADTIEIHNHRIRLLDMDAPEGQQLCQDAAGKDYRCGQQAALAQKIGLWAEMPWEWRSAQ